MKTRFESIHPLLRRSATVSEWSDYRWQLRHSITQLQQLEGLLTLTEEEKKAMCFEKHHLSFRVTPHWLSLIDEHDTHDPLRLQLIPRAQEWECHPEEREDPLHEEGHMVIPGLLHRYPDRVLILCLDRCAGYCRYCTRSRLVSGGRPMSAALSERGLAAICAYLREHTEVRDVLLSGGDPLLLSDHRLETILAKLKSIPHIEILRIGSRIPVMLPQRITPALCAMLQRYAPLYLSVHCNHARELSPEALEALGLLADHGIPLGSQTVLLRGVNDTLEAQRELYHTLLRARVRPYYLYQCDLVRGSRHFRTSVSEGLELMHGLQGHTSGYALPQYVLDAPGGGGKIPLNPQMILSLDDEVVRVRNYLGKEFSYPNM